MRAATPRAARRPGDRSTHQTDSRDIWRSRRSRFPGVPVRPVLARDRRPESTERGPFRVIVALSAVDRGQRRFARPTSLTFQPGRLKPVRPTAAWTTNELRGCMPRCLLLGHRASTRNPGSTTLGSPNPHMNMLGLRFQLPLDALCAMSTHRRLSSVAWEQPRRGLVLVFGGCGQVVGEGHDQPDKPRAVRSP